MLYFKATLLLFAFIFGMVSLSQETRLKRNRREADDGQYHPDDEGQYVPSNEGQYHHDDRGKYVHQDVKYVHQQIDPLKYVHVQSDPVKYIHDEKKYVDKDGGYARTDKDGQYVHDDSGNYAYVDNQGRYSQSGKYNFKEGGINVGFGGDGKVGGGFKAVATGGYSGGSFGTGAVGGYAGFGQLNAQSDNTFGNGGNDGKYVHDDSGKYVHVDSKYIHQEGPQGGFGAGNDGNYIKNDGTNFQIGKNSQYVTDNIKKYTFNDAYSISSNKNGGNSVLAGKTVLSEYGFGNQYFKNGISTDKSISTGNYNTFESRTSEGNKGFFGNNKNVLVGAQPETVGVLSIPSSFALTNKGNTGSTGGFGVKYTEGSAGNDGKYVHDDSGKYVSGNDGKYSQTGQTYSTFGNVFATGGKVDSNQVKSDNGKGTSENNAVVFGTRLAPIEGSNKTPSQINSVLTSGTDGVSNIPSFFATEGKNIKSEVKVSNNRQFGVKYSVDKTRPFDSNYFGSFGVTGSGKIDTSTNDGKYVHDNSGDYVHKDTKYSQTGETSSIGGTYDGGKYVQSGYANYASGNDGKYVHDNSGNYVHVDEKYKTTGTAYGGFTTGGSGRFTSENNNLAGLGIGKTQITAISKPVSTVNQPENGFVSSIPAFFSSGSSISSSKNFENEGKIGIQTPKLSTSGAIDSTKFFTAQSFGTKQSGFSNDGQYIHDDSGKYVHVDSKYTPLTGVRYSDGKYTPTNENDNAAINTFTTDKQTTSNKGISFLPTGFVYQPVAVTKLPGLEIRQELEGGNNGQVSQSGNFFVDVKQNGNTGFQYTSAGTPSSTIKPSGAFAIDISKVNVGGQNAGIYSQTETGKISTFVTQQTDGNISPFLTESKFSQPIGTSELSKTTINQIAFGKTFTNSKEGLGIPAINIPQTSEAFNINIPSEPVTAIPSFFQTSTGYSGEASFGVTTPTPPKVYSGNFVTNNPTAAFSFGESGKAGQVQGYQFSGFESQTPIGGVFSSNIGFKIGTQDVCDNSQWKNHKHICLKLTAVCLANTKDELCNNKSDKNAVCSQMIYSIMTTLYELNALK